MNSDRQMILCSDDVTILSRNDDILDMTVYAHEHRPNITNSSSVLSRLSIEDNVVLAVLNTGRELSGKKPNRIVHHYSSLLHHMVKYTCNKKLVTATNRSVFKLTVIVIW